MLDCNKISEKFYLGKKILKQSRIMQKWLLCCVKDHIRHKNGQLMKHRVGGTKHCLNAAYSDWRKVTQ